jgi:very-short-patch-repair endonuclease
MPILGLSTSSYERTKHMESLGYNVVRFWNNQGMNVDGVIRAIEFALEDD